MKGGPTDPPNSADAYCTAHHTLSFNEGGAY